MRKVLSLLILCLVCLPVTAYASLPSGWNAARNILVQGERPYKEFYLDGRVYRYAREDLFDLRIQDDKGDFVPFLIMDGYLRAKELPWTREETGDITKLSLSNVHRLEITAIKLDIPENHRRSYRLLADGKEVLTGEIMRLKTEITEVDNTEIHLPNTTRATVISIEIDNRDNRPLSLQGMGVEYYVHRVIFQDIGTGPYCLLYANPRAGKPSYDIESFRRHILQEPADKGVLGKFLQLPPDPGPTARELNLSLLFHFVIAGVSVILVVMVFRHLRIPGGFFR
jgi:hypothetical protein